MGLDQFAYAKEHCNAPEPETYTYVWRKHSKLQEFMEQVFVRETGEDASKLNCKELVLNADDIRALRTLVDTGSLPESLGGFFFGHQFQDESAQEYKTQDLQFCDWALAKLAAGECVIYSCWW